MLTCTYYTNENSTLTACPIIDTVEKDVFYVDTTNVLYCEKPAFNTSENSFWLKNGQPSGWTQLFIAIGIPLFVVFLDKWITKCHTKKKEKRERERYRKTVIDWIRLITPIENKLSESMSDLSNSIAQSDNMQPERYAMPATIPDKLGSLTVEQMMNAFVTDFKGDKNKCSAHIYNIISCLDFLSKTKNEIAKVYDAYNKQSVSCCEQWNTDISAFKKWNMQHNEATTNEIVKVWAAGLIAKKDSIQTHEKLVDDILQLHNVDVDITPTLIKMKNVIMQRKTLSSGYASIFKDFASRIDISLEHLSDACDFFEQKNAY